MAIVVGTSGPDTLDGTAGADRLYGLEDNDTLNGLAGNDLLDGGTGNDTMNGGADDDIYVIDSAGDLINESVGQGFDIAYALASYVLAAGVSLERLSSHDHLTTTALDLTGNDIVTDIYGNAGTNVLTGGAANNIILGFGGTDTLNGLGGNDLLYGMDGVDTMNGGADNDFLDGGAGDDTMAGGAGDDIYVVAGGDTVVEAAGDGFDIVYAIASYALTGAARVERLSAVDHLSTAGMTLEGNDFVVEILGNNGTNLLSGGAAANLLLGFGDNDNLLGLGGNDSLYGMDGVDTLSGGADNDFLDGGAGDDIMNGGTGDDVFLVAGGDTVGELAGEGFDIIYTTTSYVLAAGVAVERLSSSDHLLTVAQNLTGNDLVVDIYGNNGINVITGGAANNYLLGFGGDDTLNGGDGHDYLFGMDGMDTLRGGAGNDVLYGGNDVDLMGGGLGDDLYIVEQNNDIVAEVSSANEGFDTVYTYVDYRVVSRFIERLATIDSSAVSNIRLFGHSGSDILYGSAGNNLLDTGFGGTDTLTGLGGADIFNFRNVSGFFTSPQVNGIATIADFELGVDKLKLDTTKFHDLVGNSAFFEVGTVATAASTRILYDPATGNLLWDTDGNGGVGPVPAVIFGKLQPGLALTAADFIITANQAPEANPDAFSMTFTGVGFERIFVDFIQNDFDLDGFNPWVTRIGLEGTPLLAVSNGLSINPYGGKYGSLQGNSNQFTYTIDPNDPDTMALAPGQTVTETYVYEITDGQENRLSSISPLGQYAQSTFTITVTKADNGAMSAVVNPASAMAAEAARADHSTFGPTTDNAFGGDNGAIAALGVRAAADYLAPDLWIV